MFFDTPSEEASSEFEPIPAGTYKALVADSEYKQTKRGDGHFMAVAFNILEGKYKDRKVFSNFNLENKSEQAQKIGRGQFKRLLTSLGVTEPLKEVHDAHRKIQNKIVWIDVAKELGTDGKTRNVIKKYDSAPALTQVPATAATDQLDQIPF